MNLEFELQQLANNSSKKLPSEIKEIFKDSIDKLRESGIEETALRSGDKITNFTLPDATNEGVAIETLLKQGPVVINFYRGGWCPYCNLELRAYQEALLDIKSLGASLVAISPETPDNSLSTVEKNSLGFTVLSDSNNSVAKSFGLVFKVNDTLNDIYKKMGIDLTTSQANDLNELPVPATYVIDKDGLIKLAFVNSDYKKRLNIEDVLTALRSL